MMDAHSQWRSNGRSVPVGVVVAIIKIATTIRIEISTNITITISTIIHSLGSIILQVQHALILPLSQIAPPINPFFSTPIPRPHILLVLLPFHPLHPFPLPHLIHRQLPRGQQQVTGERASEYNKQMTKRPQHQSHFAQYRRIGKHPYSKKSFEEGVERSHGGCSYGFFGTLFFDFDDGVVARRFVVIIVVIVLGGSEVVVE